MKTTTTPNRCGGFTPWINHLATELMAATPPPAEAICGHFGISFGWRGLGVGFIPTTKDTMKVILERSAGDCDHNKLLGRPTFSGMRARHWDQLRTAVVAAFGAKKLTEWNGGDGHQTASMEIQIPYSHERGEFPFCWWLNENVKNYGKVADVFKYTDDEKRRAKLMHEWREAHAHLTVKPRPRAPRPYQPIKAAEITTTLADGTTRTIHLKGDIYRPQDVRPEMREECYKHAYRVLEKMSEALNFSEVETTVKERAI